MSANELDLIEREGKRAFEKNAPVVAKEAPQPFDPNKQREETRGDLARGLLWLLTFTIGGVLIFIGLGRLEGTVLTQSVFPSLIALAGTALGFYFGSQQQGQQAGDSTTKPGSTPPSTTTTTTTPTTTPTTDTTTQPGVGQPKPAETAGTQGGTVAPPGTGTTPGSTTSGAPGVGAAETPVENQTELNLTGAGVTESVEADGAVVADVATEAGRETEGGGGGVVTSPPGG